MDTEELITAEQLVERMIGRSPPEQLAMFEHWNKTCAPILFPPSVDPDCSLECETCEHNEVCPAVHADWSSSDAAGLVHERSKTEPSLAKLVRYCTRLSEGDGVGALGELL